MTNPNNITRANVAQLLLLSEKLKWHTIEKHVGKDNDYLIDRVQKNIDQGQPKIPDATTFKNLTIAEETIENALKTSEWQEIIKNVITLSKSGNNRSGQSIILNTNTIIWHGYSNVNWTPTRIEWLTKVQLNLLPDGKWWFITLSAFPLK